MKLITHTIESLGVDINSRSNIIRVLQLVLVMFFLISCDDFVDVDLPINKLTAETVFEDAGTVEVALKGIYSELRDSFLVNDLYEIIGWYTDELDPEVSIPNSPNSFYNHTLLATNSRIEGWWNNAYNLIFLANAFVDGVENSTSLTLEDKNQFTGEALFIRAYLHTLLVELFGPVPYITTTDYITNTTVSRMPVDEVYTNIIIDLTKASTLLGDDISGEGIRVYDAVVDALLARVYLYTQKWEDAEIMASKVIDRFVLEPDLNQVFLKDALGTIWQFKPEIEGKNSLEGASFIFENNPFGKPVLSTSLLNTFEFFNIFDRDLRRDKWIRTVTGTNGTWRHSYKYKEGVNPTTITNAQGEEVAASLEYSIVFRLAEQYLIRAEARVQLAKITGAQEDINFIRNRARLSNTTAATTNELLDAILHERQVELFTEGGHRWFDLKRMGKAAEVLAPIKSGWRDTDILFPIPESEILLNPNLVQNDGY
ncbi:RagB/SusD family nutrient uptake outer membrane protein [Flavivirga spongiicola]|uniref:RagB/SusD family nutrient uptake outer membrane protein n=1 Tax=Flavivirga spongiicola TaxID=421621 RepID=A0ABU7XTN7_9FLAO|nr:RagB/SusD family nutrient uptake outer membrane protein [Flavivirga sp. MEBiC05379]MDO5978212.1 RagB/SusD family nutrient uptake outer membrane protein [Flavivirga sp. MEBiC05379]